MRHSSVRLGEVTVLNCSGRDIAKKEFLSGTSPGRVYHRKLNLAKCNPNFLGDIPLSPYQLDIGIQGLRRLEQARSVVPNLWPAGQKWPARPQKVALDLLKNFKNICATTGKIPILTGWASGV